MQFLYPSFLFALIALAVPIIVHLFNFRRHKRIFFTNVRLLTDIKQAQKSRNQLRHLVLLILRMLALACIVLAFAHPFIPRQASQVNPGRKYVSIYIDNSFSMANESSEGEMLEQAKEKALEITAGYGEGDAFQLITNDFELKHQRWVNRSEFKDFVSEVQLSPAFRKVSEVVQRIKENFRKAESANRAEYLISDFQKGMADVGTLKADSSVHLGFVPLHAAATRNVYIDSVWFEGAIWQLNKSNTLVAKVFNASDQDVEDGTLTLSVNGNQKALASYSVKANSQEVVRLTFTITDEGQNRAVLKLDDYPITFDNELYFSFNVERSLAVLVINQTASDKNIDKAFAAEKTFTLTDVNLGSIDYSALPKYDFIILNGLSSISSGLAAALNDFLSQKGNVFIIPPVTDMQAEGYNSFLGSVSAGSFGGVVATQQNVAALDPKNPFFMNMFEEVPRNMNMPSVGRYYDLGMYTGSKGSSLLRFSNGSPFLTMTPAGKGYLFVLAAPIDPAWSNFSNHALFLPILYKASFYSTQQEKLYYIIGRDNYIQLPTADEEKERIFKLVKDSFEIIPPQRMLDGNLNLFVEGLIIEAGHYSLRGNDAGKKTIATYSFNYNRQESDMSFLSASTLKEEAAAANPSFLDAEKASLTHEIKAMQEGVKLWKWFVLAALIFLLGETLLIRFWK